MKVQHTILIHMNKMPRTDDSSSLVPDTARYARELGELLHISGHFRLFAFSVKWASANCASFHLLCSCVRPHSVSTWTGEWYLGSAGTTHASPQDELFVIYSNRLVTILRERELILPSLPSPPAFSSLTSNTFVY